MTRTTRSLAALTLAAALAACGGAADTAGEDVDVPAPQETSTADDGAAEDQADDTSTPADEDAVQQAPTSLTTGEAEAVGNAYLGLTLEEVEEQALIDDREWRIGVLDGEQRMLTEDYVVGRITLDVVDDVVVGVTVEATDGPVTVPA